MASAGIRSGGGTSCSLPCRIGPAIGRMRPRSLAICNHARSHAESGVLSISRDPRRYVPKSPGLEINGEGYGQSESRALAEQRLDEWIDMSVSEIVKRLHDAPLFVHVYERDRKGSRRGLDLRMERSVEPGYWDAVRAKWEKGESSLPEGVMLVEELTDDEERPEEVRRNDSGDKVTKIWGIVVQGKGADSAMPACYLLKTSRVSSGLEFCSTHFFVTRVQNFREKATTQLRNCWLVRRGEPEPLILSGICEMAK